MIRTRHRIILAAGVVIILGAFTLLPRQVPEPLLEDAIRNRTSEELGLAASDTLSIAAQSGKFVRVNLHSAEGGGIWAIVLHTSTSTEIITKGQDHPACAPLEAASVPIDLEPMCWAEDGKTLVGRSDR